MMGNGTKRSRGDTLMVMMMNLFCQGLMTRVKVLALSTRGFCLFLACLLLLLHLICFCSLPIYYFTYFLLPERIKCFQTETPCLKWHLQNPRPAWFWLKALISHLFMVKLVFFRHHWCSDSCPVSWLLLDQNMTKACVMTFGDICIFICDIKNSSLLPQVFLSSSWNTVNTVSHISAKWTWLSSPADGIS